MNILKWFGGLFSGAYNFGVTIGETPSVSQVRAHLRQSMPEVVVRDGKSAVVLRVPGLTDLDCDIAIAKMEDPAKNEAFADGVVVGWNSCKEHVLKVKRSAIRSQNSLIRKTKLERQAAKAEAERAAASAPAESAAAGPAIVEAL